jgi:hypothetical protein
MAKIRIGFGSDFVLENSEVGIGTTNPTAKLQVAGTLKGDFNVSGISTLTVYGGFVSQNQNISLASTTGFSTTGVGTFTQPYETDTGYASLVGEYNTVSEDLIVDEGKIFEVSTTNITGITTLGTQEVYAPDDSVVSVGTLESVSIQSHFSVPNGGISSRPNQPTEGMVRFNDDLNTLEFYNGIEWRQFTVSGASGRGVFGSSVLTYINISSTGNAQNFGVSTQSRVALASFSSSTRGLWSGGYQPGGSWNIIDYVTIASEGNAIDFGDLTANRFFPAGCSSSTRGLTGGGFSNLTNIIDYVQIATIGNALDFGDLTSARSTNSSTSSATRGVWAGGQSSSIIDYVTIASLGNAITFGTLTNISGQSAGCSSSTRGVFGGRFTPAANNIAINVIDYITFASTGNATYFGDLTVARAGAFACSNAVRGVFAGGQTPTAVNTIDYITITSIGNAIDFGDLTENRAYNAGCSDSHGGLGGF